MSNQKGQVAIEYEAIMMLVLIVVAVVVAYSTYVTQRNIQFEKAQNSAKTLVNAANTLYGMGPGAKLVVEVNLPSGIQSPIIGRRGVGWRVTTFGNTGDIFFESDVNIVGNLPTTDGKQLVIVAMDESGVVRIGDRGLNLSPNIAYTRLPPGTTKTVDFNAENRTGASLSGLGTVVTGPAAGFISVGGLAPTLPADSNDAFQAVVSVPGGTAAGVYDAKMEIVSNEKFNDFSSVPVEVQHKLRDVNVWLYKDRHYSSPATSFFPRQVVYYEARFFDQTMSLFDLSDINVAVTDNLGGTVKTERPKSSGAGKYQSSYTLPCTAASGTWGVRIDANSHNTVSDSNNFSVLASQQQAFFDFEWESSGFDATNRVLRNWTLSNNTDCQSVGITKMKVTWANDNDGGQLSTIKLNNNTVWTGTAASGTELTLSSTFTVPVLTSYFTDNTLEFTATMNDDVETFQIVFTFSDNSTFTTTIYQR